MSGRPLRRLALSAAALLLLLAAGCPTISIRSLEVLRFKKNVATLVATIDVDNGADDAGDASSSLALALEPGWVLEDVRYQIPGEPLERRARTAPGVAALAAWTFTADGLTWWGYRTVEHTIPAGQSTYTATFTVRVPRGTRGGQVVLLVGDPGPDAVIEAYDLTLKPRGEAVTTDAPAVNPASQVQAEMATQDMDAALGEFGTGLGELGGDMGGAGDVLEGLGAMLGMLPGAEGFRTPWVEEHTTDGTLRAAGVAVDLPPDCSVIAEEPEGDAVELVLIPPGAAYAAGLAIHRAATEADAAAIVERELQIARDDMGSDAVVVTDVSWETSGGLALAGKDLAVVQDGRAMHTVITHRHESGILVIAVAMTDEDGVEEARRFLGSVLDATRFEP